MIGPFPKDRVIGFDGFLSRTWNVWLNNVRDFIDFGVAASPNTDVVATAGIKITNNLMRIKSSTGAPITITANPQISNGSDGQLLILEGLDNTATIQIVNGSGLALAGGVAFVIGNNDTIRLIFNKNKGLWLELSRSNN